MRSWAFDAIIVVLFLFGFFWWQTRALIPTGVEAPPFELRVWEPSPSNPNELATPPKVISLNDLKGKKTILAFWAPWCSVCRAEVSTVNALKRILGDEANVYTVVLDYYSFASVKEFVDELGLKAPVLLGTPELARAYKVNSFPTVYMIDSDGKVINQTVGYSTQMGIRARLWASDFFR